jgi:hypothetical protein
MQVISSIGDTINEIEEFLGEQGNEELAEASGEIEEILKRNYEIMFLQIEEALVCGDWLNPDFSFNNESNKPDGEVIISKLEMYRNKLQIGMRNILIRFGLYPHDELDPNIENGNQNYRIGTMIMGYVNDLNRKTFNRVQEILLAEDFLCTGEIPIGYLEAEMEVPDYFPDPDKEEIHTSTMKLLEDNENLVKFKEDVLKAVKKTNSAQALGESVLKMLALEAIDKGRSLAIAGSIHMRV